MSGPVADAERDVQEKMKELEEATELVRGAGDMKGKKDSEREARKIYAAVRKCLNVMRNEVNKLDDATQKSIYTRRHTELNTKLTKFDNELKRLLRPPRKGKTGEEAAMDGIMGDGDVNDTGKVYQAANRAQDDNLRILESIERTANVVEETGNEITQKLAVDTEKIKEIDKELDTLQANIDRAKGEVEWFARQMATDKCFITLIVVVVLGLCMLTFWKIYTSRSGKSSTPAAAVAVDRTLAPPPTPALTNGPTTAAAFTSTFASPTTLSTTLGASTTVVPATSTPATTVAATVTVAALKMWIEFATS